MLEFTNELIENMEDDLRIIEEKAFSMQEKFRQSVLKIEEYINYLKEKMRGIELKNEDDEIDFFRNILPLFYSKLILSIRLYNLETNRLGIGRKLYKKLLHDELKDINLFFKKQITFKQYYYSGNSLLDKELFTRNHLQLPFLLTDCSFALDPTFCTTYSLILSQMLALEKLQDHIFHELRKLNNIALPNDVPNINPKKWLLGSFALIELGYLLHLTGAVQGSLKETMSFLEKCFDTNLGNYSRTLQKMRIRQGERAAFLSKGIDSFYKHMDRLDDENL